MKHLAIALLMCFSHLLHAQTSCGIIGGDFTQSINLDVQDIADNIESDLYYYKVHRAAFSLFYSIQDDPSILDDHWLAGYGITGLAGDMFMLADLGHRDGEQVIWSQEVCVDADDKNPYIFSCYVKTLLNNTHPVNYYSNLKLRMVLGEDFIDLTPNHKTDHQTWEKLIGLPIFFYNSSYGSNTGGLEVIDGELKRKIILQIIGTAPNGGAGNDNGIDGIEFEKMTHNTAELTFTDICTDNDFDIQIINPNATNINIYIDDVLVGQNTNHLFLTAAQHQLTEGVHFIKVTYTDNGISYIIDDFVYVTESKTGLVSLDYSYIFNNAVPVGIALNDQANTFNYEFSRYERTNNASNNYKGVGGELSTLPDNDGDGELLTQEIETTASPNKNYFCKTEMYHCNANLIRKDEECKEICTPRSSPISFTNTVTYNPTTGKYDVAFTPQNFDSDQIIELHWDFDDGTNADQTNGAVKNHSFSEQGKYRVCLMASRTEQNTVPVVTSNNDCPAEVYCEVIDLCPEITPDYLATNICFEPGNAQPSSFNGDPNGDDANDELKYTWFADGVKFAAGKTPTHTFERSGYYDVTLIKSSSCHSEEFDFVYTVYRIPVTDIINLYNASNGLIVTLTPSTSFSTGYSYEWDYNGNVIGTSEDVTYTFPNNGTYIVGLKVTSPEGCEYTTSKTICANVIPAGCCDCDEASQ